MSYKTHGFAVSKCGVVLEADRSGKRNKYTTLRASGPKKVICGKGSYMVRHMNTKSLKTTTTKKTTRAFAAKGYVRRGLQTITDGGK